MTCEHCPENLDRQVRFYGPEREPFIGALFACPPCGQVYMWGLTGQFNVGNLQEQYGWQETLLNAWGLE